jgi:ribosomal protein S6
VCGEITRLDGNVLTTEVLGKRTFARPMQKRDNGIYVKIRFELDPSQVSVLLGRYRLAEDVFRVQILAVDDRREAVLARQAEERKVREAARAAAEEATTEDEDNENQDEFGDDE